MARFDVYRNPRKESAREVPFLLDVQSAFLEGLETRVVVPLRAASAVKRPVTRLNPVFQVAGVEVVMDTPQLAGVPGGHAQEACGIFGHQSLRDPERIGLLVRRGLIEGPGAASRSFGCGP